MILFLSQSGHSPYRTRDQVFEERNDEELAFGQKLPIGAAISKDVLGPDVDVEREVLPSSPQEPSPERDPLYVVHYVPQAKEATSQPPKTEAGHDVLAKILSASKAGHGKRFLGCGDLLTINMFNPFLISYFYWE